jgi:hypothetical protein
MFWNRRDRGRLRVSGSYVPCKRSQREREFITATKIGRWSDIAVMAQFQRNAGIHVALVRVNA